MRRFLSVLLVLAMGSTALADAPTTRRAAARIVLAGDSTVTDAAGWGGEAFRQNFDAKQVEIINLARGGRSSKSFRAEGRWKQALEVKPDYILIQFGHNDQPGHGDRESDPVAYRQNLAQYIDEAQAAGIRPVLVTPLARRQWRDGVIKSTLIPYADAAKSVAAEKNVPLIDLHERSIEVYQSLGQEGCEDLISPPKPNGWDGTHLNTNGGILFGCLMADALTQAVPELRKYRVNYKLPTERAVASTRPSTRPADPPATEATSQGAKTITVAADGSGDFKRIQDAIAVVADNNADRTTIRIRPGVYYGQIVLPRGKQNVSFVGDDPATTIITYALNVYDPIPDGVPKGTNGNGLVVRGAGFRAKNLTLRNTSGDHGQAMAVRNESDRSVFENCRLLGWQDTLLTHSGRQYYKDCYIEGRVDFIYGGATAVFENCEIRSKIGGYVTAASTPENQPYGYVFLNCRLTSEDGVPTYLGRPWRPFASVVFIGCEMGAHIRPEGWHNWGKESNEQTARYAEFNSTGPGATPDRRVAWSKQLTKEQADAITVQAVFGGQDGWDPTAMATLPAFPGAEGFGAKASGGRGGAVYEVTSLADAGPGSLRDALSQGDRTVVFRVSGTIELKSSIKLRKPNVTIAGQTAPGDGICIRGRELTINADNVIVRFLRFRPGDELNLEHDALTVWGAKNVIIDHCSMSWSTDSVSDVVKGSRDVTIQWCIVSEPLNRSVHVKGAHGYGTGWGYGSYHHNLIAHCASRTPRLGSDPDRGLIDVRNNVVYDWGFGWAYGGEHANVNFVGNYFRPGPSSEHRNCLFNAWSSDTRIYLADNVLEGNEDVTADNLKGLITKGSIHEQKVMLADVPVKEPFPAVPVTTHTAREAYELVLANAGATLPKRDAVDQRVVKQVRERGGKIINSQKDVGGWPELKSAPPPDDSDHDGIPDAWENAHGLNPADPADGRALAADGNGYTNLETYLNELAAGAK